MRNFKKNFILFIVECICFSIVGSEFSQAGQHQNAFYYVHWDYNGGANRFTNTDQFFRITKKAPGTFWAQLWSWSGFTNGGYIGLQTDGTYPIHTSRKTEVAIFSLWDANAASGPHCGTFGGEGIGYSCRIPFSIRENSLYRFRVWRLGSDGGGVWWGAWIYDNSANREYYIGKIRVLGNRQFMGPSRNFTEYYGSDRGCSGVPVSNVEWTNPASDSKGNGAYAYYSKFNRGTKGSCTGGGHSRFNWGWGSGIAVKMGGR